VRPSLRHALVRSRRAAGVLRRRLQPYRLLIAAIAAAIGTVLGTVYEGMSPVQRATAVVAIFVLTVLAVVTEAPGPQPRWPLFFRQSAATKPLQVKASRLGLTRTRWLRRWAGRIVPSVPASDALFRGRIRELEALEQRHAVSRAARERTRSRRLVDDADPALGTTGPLLLLAHGKPGVGKSALALELVRRLARHYPHGQIYATLSTTNGARPPGDILKDFLDALGWPTREIPPDQIERAKIFRSLTAKRRMLFVLDAAQDAQQVARVLPADPRCAVIVTSRRDLGPGLHSTSYHLDVPDTDEAITMLRAASDTDDGARPECAVDIVEACGALPLALRAAAERAWIGRTELCHVAHLIKPPASRLSWLERAGTSVAERLASQYERLIDQEKRALRLLTLVESSTFVPWVLAPLLDVRITEAENVMTRLNAAQMVDNAGSDDVTGLARYRFHPLVRLYAEAERRAQTHDDDARSRLDSAYREVMVAVLSRQDPTFEVQQAHRYLPRQTDFVKKIVTNPEPWIRAEYPNLLRQVLQTHKREPELCWRLAAQLDGCVPEGQRSHKSLEAYEHAVAAADGNPVAVIRVLLAKASFLIAIERYSDAISTLDKARSGAFDLRISNHHNVAEAERLEIVAMRKAGEAHVQMASYRTAAEILRQAFDRATAAGDKAERDLIRDLLAEAHQIDGFESAVVNVSDRHIGDTQRFRALLVLCDSARRRADWTRAREHLDKALSLSGSHARRAATVHYRMARLYLEEHLATKGWPDYATGQGIDDRNVLSLAEQAVRRAAAAAVMFRRMGNPVGLVRAHCLLARAMLAAGYLVEAERVAHATVRDYGRLPPRVLGPAADPLLARLQRTLGDLLLCRGDPVSARRLLLQAATTYGWVHDWAAETDTLRRLRAVRWSADGPQAVHGLDDMADRQLQPSTVGTFIHEPDEDDPFATDDDPAGLDVT
jgi:tetratricopeptide (TPR) repeat protein